MTRKRDPISRSTVHPSVTPVVIDLFRRVEAAKPDNEEGDEGYSEEYLDARMQLHMMLKWPPWATLPCDIHEDDERPDWANGEWHRSDWDRAMEMRKALLAAMKP
jgi:hypothetical protein